MTGEYEAKSAMQMANTVMDGTSRIISALIDALSEKCRNPQDRRVLEEFRRYVADGGSLLTVTADICNQAEFETALKESGIMAYKAETAYKPGMAVYIFRASDAGHMDDVILSLRNRGVELVESRQTEYATLLQNAGGKLHTAVLSAKQANQCRLRLDAYGIPYTVTEYPDRTEIAIPTADYERIKDLPDISIYKMRSVDEKTTMRDVRRIVEESVKAAEAEKQHERESKKAKTGREV